MAAAQKSNTFCLLTYFHVSFTFGSLIFSFFLTTPNAIYNLRSTTPRGLRSILFYAILEMIRGRQDSLPAPFSLCIFLLVFCCCLYTAL